MSGILKFVKSFSGKGREIFKVIEKDGGKVLLTLDEVETWGLFVKKSFELGRKARNRACMQLKTSIATRFMQISWKLHIDHTLKKSTPIECGKAQKIVRGKFDNSCYHQCLTFMQSEPSVILVLPSPHDYSFAKRAEKDRGGRLFHF